MWGYMRRCKGGHGISMWGNARVDWGAMQDDMRGSLHYNPPLGISSNIWRYQVNPLDTVLGTIVSGFVLAIVIALVL